MCVWLYFYLMNACFMNAVCVVVQIVMEYCGAGSVSDIMRLRNKTVSVTQTARLS